MNLCSEIRWNRIPDDVRDQIVELALDEPELSPRELAVRFTDTKNYFVSEASVYRLTSEITGQMIGNNAGIVIGAVNQCRLSRPQIGHTQNI